MASLDEPDEPIYRYSMQPQKQAKHRVEIELDSRQWGRLTAASRRWERPRRLGAAGDKEGAERSASAQHRGELVSAIQLK